MPSSDVYDMNSDAEELNITVAVRCRGRNEREVKAKSSVVVTVPDITGSSEVSINTTGDIGITAQMNSKTYTVDKVFGPSASQVLVFEQIAKPLFRDFMKGYNCTVLVYGMTSTGKTYTMTGDENLYNGELSDAAGIIPRVLFDLFETLEQEKDDYVVKCSFVELYNEELKDLLNEGVDMTAQRKLRIYDSNPSSTSQSNSRTNSRHNSPRLGTDSTSANALAYRLNRSNSNRTSNSNATNKTGNISVYGSRSSLPNRQQVHANNKNSHQSNSVPTQQPSIGTNNDQNAGIYIQNLQEFHITSAKEGISVLQKGLNHRQVASTKMNDFSSRSHTIFTITLYKEYKGEMFRVSKMNLVDLAGSENISRSGALNQRAKEAGSINQSLLTLGRVINALADKSGHIPFRESKLTRLLQDSLGGNTKTALIATISPAKVTSEETCSTLEYASKAKNIKNKPQLGSFIMKDILVKNITFELAKIKADLLSTKSKEGVFMSQENYKGLTAELESYKTELQESNRKVESLDTHNKILAKEKRQFKELNEIQRVKLENFQARVDILDSTINEQLLKQRDQELSIQKANSTIESLNSTISKYQKKYLELTNIVNVVLPNKISQGINEININFNELKSTHTSSVSDLRPNLDRIQDQIIEWLHTTQENVEIMYKDCLKEIMEETPLILTSVKDRVREAENAASKYYATIAENLSDISEENNNFKQYFDNNLFRNNHEEILTAHVDRTYKEIEDTSAGLITHFKSMLDELLEKNKKLMQSSLNSATTDIIRRELQLLDPHKKKWQESFGIVNRCDSLNNNFHHAIKNELKIVNQTVETSSFSINDAITSIQQRVEEWKSSSALMNDNNKLKKDFEAILEKDHLTKDYLLKSLDFTESSLDNFKSIASTVQDLLTTPMSEENTKTDKNEITSISNSNPTLAPRRDDFGQERLPFQHVTESHMNIKNPEISNLTPKKRSAQDIEAQRTDSSKYPRLETPPGGLEGCD